MSLLEATPTASDLHATGLFVCQTKLDSKKLQTKHILLNITMTFQQVGWKKLASEITAKGKTKCSFSSRPVRKVWHPSEPQHLHFSALDCSLNWLLVTFLHFTNPPGNLLLLLGGELVIFSGLLQRLNVTFFPGVWASSEALQGKQNKSKLQNMVGMNLPPASLG